MKILGFFSLSLLDSRSIERRGGGESWASSGIVLITESQKSRILIPHRPRPGFIAVWKLNLFQANDIGIPKLDTLLEGLME